MKRKQMCILVLIGLLAVIGLSGCSRQEPAPVQDAAEVLDLRDQALTIEQYVQMKDQNPQCQIRWSVPFQGGFLEDDTQSVTVNSLTWEDAQAFAYLPELQAVSLEGELPQPEVLKALAAAYPNVAFSWCLEIGGETLKTDTKELMLSGWKPDRAKDLENLLAYGPSLQKLTILDSGLDYDVLQAFHTAHPELELVWDMTLGGKTFRTDAQELDLSHVAFSDITQLEDLIGCMPKLTWIDVSFCGLPSEELDVLNRKYENVRIVWTIPIGAIGYLRTDATYFMPYQMDSYVRPGDLEELKYCTDMVCIDVGHCQITDCEFVRTMPHLKYLILADSAVESLEPLRGLQELVYLEVFITPVTDFSPLLDCPALLDLNICQNHLGNSEILAQMTQLERLWIAPFDVDPFQVVDLLEMFTEALPNTQVVYSPNSTAKGWRQHPRYFEMRDILGMHYMS